MERHRKANRIWKTASPSAAGFFGATTGTRAAKAWIRARTNDKTDTPDAILLADVVYGENERIWRDLVKTLRSLARGDGCDFGSRAARIRRRM